MTTDLAICVTTFQIDFKVNDAQHFVGLLPQIRPLHGNRAIVLSIARMILSSTQHPRIQQFP